MLRVHPKYLSDSSLLAVWREGLRGQKKIVRGQGWADFVLADKPLEGVGAYLSFIASEGLGRGYRINHELIEKPNFDEGFLPLSLEQLDEEKAKLNVQDDYPLCHPIYHIVQ